MIMFRYSNFAPDSRQPVGLPSKLALGILFFSLGATPVPAWAKSTSVPDPAVQRVQEALSSRSHYPWYDTKSDKLARIEVRPEPAQPDPLSKLPWSQSIEMADLLVILAWIVLGVLLAGMTALLIMAFLQRETSAPSVGEVQAVVATKVPAGRMESLLDAAQTNLGDLLGSARTSYQQGDYARATVLLFSHQLVELDRHHRIALAQGKTNRQYLREIERGQTANGPLIQLVAKTMVLFERTLFGHHLPSREEFEACWYSMEQFHGLLQQPTGATV